MVAVFLVRVKINRTIVGLIGHTIFVLVASQVLRFMFLQHRVAGISVFAARAIFLVGVEDEHTVVIGVGNSVAIDVRAAQSSV